jgi:hypothetical protein
MSALRALRTMIESAVRLAKLAGLTNKLIYDLLVDVARALIRPRALALLDQPRFAAAWQILRNEKSPGDYAPGLRLSVPLLGTALDCLGHRWTVVLLVPIVRINWVSRAKVWRLVLNMANEAPKRDEKLIVPALLASLENERRLIAAGKIQCWDLVKWVVTLNIALTGGQLAALRSAHSAPLCLALGGLAVLVWVIGYDLLRHTSDQRMRGARRAAWLLENHLETRYGINPRGIAQQSKLEPREDYDAEVLRPYRWAILVSVVPAVLVAAWALYRACPGILTWWSVAGQPASFSARCRAINPAGVPTDG